MAQHTISHDYHVMSECFLNTHPSTALDVTPSAATTWTGEKGGGEEGFFNVTFIPASPLEGPKAGEDISG